MNMFMSNMSSSTGIGALRIIAHCMPMNPPHLLPLLAPVVPTLYQLALEVCMTGCQCRLHSCLDSGERNLYVHTCRGPTKRPMI
jgi:hypothetical protein